MNRDNKKDIKYSPELKESVDWLKKRHTLTPSDKRKLKAFREKIIRIVEKTKKTHPGKTGWKYLENILDNDLDLYPHLRNHIIKLLKQYGIELRIHDNSLYNETIGEEAEEIMIGVFASEYNRSNIADLEKIPLKIVDKIKDELEKKKYKDKDKRLRIIQDDGEDIKPYFISEQNVSNDIRTDIEKHPIKNIKADIRREDTVSQPLIVQKYMVRIKEILTHEQWEVFDLHVIEHMKLKDIASLKGIKYSRVKQIYRTVKNKIKKDKIIDF